MQTPCGSMRTLKGIFQEPKMNHRRDFLRENKLNLRELQKNTTNKLVQKQQEQERKQQKYLHRRSDSQQRYESTGRTGYTSSTRMTADRGAGAVVTPCNGGTKQNGIRGRPEEGMRQKQLSFRRSYSQQRVGEQINPYERNAGEHYKADNRNTVPRSASVVSFVSKAESCDKEIQTEDIIDEEFLYRALKKCSNTEVDYCNSREDANPVSKTNANSYSANPTEDDLKIASEHVPYEHQKYNVEEENQNRYYQYSPRSQYSHMANGHNEENFVEQFENLQLNTHQLRDEETRSSARSRQTMFSTASKKKSNGNYKFGSRDEIRLPRYLEKEKREKEEERQREISRDPNCPLGHYAISEAERLAALNAAEKKMESLIQELNRMPMTTETLRIRRRKVEIEKELSQIELDIRTFSKPKVYVPASNEPSSHLY
uniref:Enkurin domain-containing protein n=1 Tax=Musca domestica TaxID=7370 RepID=A0A1I8NL34_MUSDO